MGSKKGLETTALLAALAGWLILVPDAYAQLNCNPGVEFYPDGGGIRRCVLNGEHKLYTAAGFKVICAHGKPLTQHLDGALRSCGIEKVHSFDGQRCEPPAEVVFSPDGRLRACRRS